MIKKIIKNLILEEKRKENIKETHQILSEASLGRVIQKYFDIGFIIISADRSCEAEKGSPCSEKEAIEQTTKNKINEKNIRADIREAGFGFVPTFGGFREEVIDSEGNIKLIDNPEPEKSFIIPSQKAGSSVALKDYEKLKKLGVLLSRKYNQDSFLYKPPQDVDKNAYYIDKNNNIDMTFDDVTVNNMDQIYFTRLRKENPGRRLTLTENQKFILYIPHSPSCFAEAKKRYGEIFIKIK